MVLSQSDIAFAVAVLGMVVLGVIYLCFIVFDDTKVCSDFAIFLMAFIVVLSAIAIIGGLTATFIYIGLGR